MAVDPSPGSRRNEIGRSPVAAACYQNTIAARTLRTSIVFVFDWRGRKLDLIVIF